MPLKAVLFDLDDTLFGSKRLTRKARWEACDAMRSAGLPAKSTKEAYSRLQEIVKLHGSNFPSHYDKLVEDYGLGRNPEIVTSGRIAYHNSKFALLHPFPHTAEVLLVLAKTGMKLGIVTNGLVDKQWEKLLRLKIRHFFESVVISGKAGSKQDKRPLIKRALRKLRVKPKDAAFVGDKLDADIAAANALGLMTIRMIPPGTTISEKPSKKKEIPDHTIRRVSALPGVLGL